MTEFTLDLSNMEVPEPSDPQNNSFKDGQKAVAIDAPYRRNGVYDGLDQRFLATVSPRNPRRNSVDLLETAHFLKACFLCKRRLFPGRDIYMYRGDSAFCSLECRQQQMNQDERKEKCSLASKKEAPSSTAGPNVSSKGETVAAL